MKELYTKPVSDIQEFKTVDVVTTSGFIPGKDDGIEPGDVWEQ